MNRRNFGLALIALVAAAATLTQKGLRQVASRFFHSLIAWYQTRAKLDQRQKRIDAADQDLDTIVEAELRHIEKRGKFATLDELVSSYDLGPEMAGRHGYVYSVSLEQNAIIASAYPAPGEQLPSVFNQHFGPAVTKVLARTQKER